MLRKTYNQALDEHLHILIAQGNHEAFNRLRRRYHLHAVSLVNDLLKQYKYTGLTSRELLSVSEEHFFFVVSRYLPGSSSFYSFWKNNTTQFLMNYLIDRSTDDSYISFDQKEYDKFAVSELIGETGDERMLKRKIFEIKHIIHKYEVFFTVPEKTILSLLLEGYSLGDFEHTGMLKRSQINLTYKSAIEKVQKFMGIKQ